MPVHLLWICGGYHSMAKRLQKRPWRLHLPWIRLIITIIVFLFIVIILILNIQGSTILAVLGVIFAMFKWLFPVPSRKHDPSSPTSSASPMPQVVVHVPPDFSLQSSPTNTLIQRDNQRDK